MWFYFGNFCFRKAFKEKIVNKPHHKNENLQFFYPIQIQFVRNNITYCFLNE